MSSNDEVKVRFIAGTVSPIGTDRHPMPQQEPLLPPYIRRISASIEVSDYTTEGVNEAMQKRYWGCVDELTRQGANSITLSGFPIASQLGRPACWRYRRKPQESPARSPTRTPKRVSRPCAISA